MKIYLGPGGNCISAKEKGTFGSFGRINEIGLNSQEIEFVRKVYLTKKNWSCNWRKGERTGNKSDNAFTIRNKSLFECKKHSGKFKKNDFGSFGNI